MQGKLIKLLRKAAELRQQDAAAYCDVQREYLSKVENGKATPSQKLIGSFCELVGMQPGMFHLLCSVEFSSLWESGEQQWFTGEVLPKLLKLNNYDSHTIAEIIQLYNNQ